MNIKRPFLTTKQSVGSRRRQAHSFKMQMVLAAAAAAFSLSPAWAAAPGGNDFEKLENKFFHRTYVKDTSDARLGRLEKMVFGEAKEGSDRDRLDNLMKMLPQDDPEIAEQGTAGGGGSTAPSKAGAGRTASSSPAKTAPAPRGDEGTAYPAVSAIERKLLGRDFEGEQVEERLTRLEKKAFGKQSASTDLSERMDALKERTGIDVARRPAAGSDWNDEEDDDTDYPEPSAPSSRRYSGVPMADSGKSFSGRDVAGDLNKAFNRQPQRSTGYGGSGSYGMSGTGGSGSLSSGGSGSYGFGSGSTRPFGGSSSSSFGGQRSSAGTIDPDAGNDRIAYTPPAAPPLKRGEMPPTAPARSAAGGMGGSAQGGGGLTISLDQLETQVFGKTYRDPLIQRLERLETTVFPGDKNAKSRTPAERVARLATVIPIGAAPQSQLSHNAAGNRPEAFDGDGGVDRFDQQIPADAQIAQQRSRNRGGLGKIINSLGNFLGGGMAVGSFPMNSGTLITDPQTGMLLDQYSGNLINPATGAVVGRKAGFGYPATVPGYGMNSFNNGFSSPYYSPYSNPMYSNPAYGIGGSGLRFGTGAGGIRFGGGMWP